MPKSKKPYNDQNPVVTARVTLEVFAAINAMAKEQGLSRSAAAEKILMAGLGKVDLKAISAEVRAANKVADEVKTVVLVAIREALDAYEKDKEGEKG